MGLESYGFIASDIKEFVLSISADIRIEDAQKQMTKLVLDEIAAAVDGGGATTGLRLEKLTGLHGEIAVRAERVIELRAREMLDVRVGVAGDKIDLHELWLTAYGYEILSILDLRLTTDSKGLKKVKRAVEKIGFELMTDEESNSGVKMSDGLKKAIWWIIENRGKPWNQIPTG
jgi:hypothetical protein